MGDVTALYVQCPWRLPHHHLSIRQQLRRNKLFLYWQGEGVDSGPFVLHVIPTIKDVFGLLVPSFLIQFWTHNKNLNLLVNSQSCQDAAHDLQLQLQ